MNMVTCDRCSKLFGSPGPRICPACSKELDKIYERAREYLRDHPRERLNVSDLAEILNEEAADIDLLVAAGRLRLWDDNSFDDREGERERLLKAFQKNLSRDGGKEGSILHAANRYRKRP